MNEFSEVPGTEGPYHGMLEELTADPVDNCSLLGFFSQYPVEAAYRCGDSFVIAGTSDFLWAYISSKDENELRQILEYSADPGIRCFAAVEDWMVPLAQREAEVQSRLTALRLVMPPDECLDSDGPQVHPLTPDAADTICRHSIYRMHISPDYIVDRIRRGVSGGIRNEHGEWVAWAVTHDDGSIGNLHVLPEYRRKGYARALVIDAAIRIRAAGRMIVTTVEPDNTASLELVRSLGFRDDRIIHWLV